MSKMVLPVSEIPGVIRESMRTVLTAHGFDVVCVEQVPGPGAMLKPITPDQREALLNEVGRNSAMALFSIDETLLMAEEPTGAEKLAVAETLRSLGFRGAPNIETAKALAKVGDWLRDVARAELAKKAA